MALGQYMVFNFLYYASSRRSMTILMVVVGMRYRKYVFYFRILYVIYFPNHCRNVALVDQNASRKIEKLNKFAFVLVASYFLRCFRTLAEE